LLALYRLVFDFDADPPHPLGVSVLIVEP
jgi:hypothetical protein